jgi:methionyl-tRNA formyltransferase
LRIVCIGCVEFSYVAVAHLLQQSGIEITGIVTRSASAYNADFRSLEPLAIETGIPCFLADAGDQDELGEWLRRQAPEVAICLGWSELLKGEILRIPPMGIIGYHPSALPRNRGRHPIVWTLALGLSETASTFFFMDEGADSGEIIDQRPVPVDFRDDARSLYEKLLAVALVQLEDLALALSQGRPRSVPQDHTQANYWRRRSKLDGLIDWRMSAESIYNLVRALTRPYVGAHCLFAGEEVKIWRVEPCADGPAHLEPGKVIKMHGSELVVRSGEGSIRIIEHEFLRVPPEGSYLL